MAASIIIPDETLRKLRSHQLRRTELLYQLGQLVHQQSQLVAHLNQIDEEANTVGRQLSEQYGDVTVNLDTGTLTPITG